MHYLTLLIILSVLSVIILRILKRRPKIQEDYTSEFCPDCHNNGWWDENYCQRCLNCGWSVGADGHGQCVPGSRKGPIIDNNTQDWYHGGDLIWSKGGALGNNNIISELDKMPLDTVRPFQRTDVSYGKHRRGRAFGHGWDPIYQNQRY